MHSAKDVPAELPGGLAIVGVPERADPRDALCGAGSLDELAARAPSWARRACAAARCCSPLRPDLDVRELRGNVDTRLRRLAEGDFDAIVLAQAGLDRLGRGDEGAPLEPDASCRPPGQGCLALEARDADERGRRRPRRSPIADALTCLTAERALVSARWTPAATRRSASTP